MSTLRWLGAAKAVAQVNTITPSVDSTDDFTVTINGKSLTFTSIAVTVREVCAGLAAMIKASTEPEFQEVTVEDLRNLIRLTARTPGKPFTQTSSATNASSLTTAVATANSGPHSWSTAANWSTGAVPVNSDDVFIETNVDILYGLDQSSVTLTSLNISGEFTSKLGLPEYNSAGYREYRDKELAIGASSVRIGYGQGPGSPLLRLNFGSVQTAVTIFKTGLKPAEAGTGSLRIRGTHASNVVEIIAGLVDIGTLGGHTTVIATLSVGKDPYQPAPVVVCGTGVTLTTVRVTNGTVETHSAMTTLTVTGGTVNHYAGAVTTINAYGGIINYASSGTITTLSIGPSGTFRCARDLTSRTITTTYIEPGGVLDDPMQTITFTNAPVTDRGYVAVPPFFVP